MRISRDPVWGEEYRLTSNAAVDEHRLEMPQGPALVPILLDSGVLARPGSRKRGVMPAPLAYRFDHLHVFCSDVDATERWFVEGLGAALVERRLSRGVRTSELNLGGAHILIRAAREGEQLASGGARRFGADHFGLRVVDVDATVAELRRRGVTIDVEPWDFGPALRIAFVKGPDDVRIELVQPKEPPTDPSA